MYKKLITPVALIIYNRPLETQQAFEAIRRVKPKELYIISDSAKNQLDVDAVMRSREIIKKIDWDCELKIDFAETHLGCKKRMISGFRWLFSQVEEAIIVEDDIVAAESFFYFCQEMLDYYRQDERIFTVSGCNIGFKSKRNNEASYFFSKFMNMWGWATWKRAYNRIDFSMSYLDKYIKSNSFKYYLGYDSRWIKHWTDKFSNTKDGVIDTWDYQWLSSQLFHKGLTVVPYINMIRNIGYGARATHTVDVLPQRANLSASNMIFPIKYQGCKKIRQNNEYEIFIKYSWFGILSESKFISLARIFVPKFMLTNLHKVRHLIMIRKTIDSIKMVKVVLINSFRSHFLPKKYPAGFMPLSLLSAYTMQGRVKLEYWYINGFLDHQKPNIYKKEQIDLFLERIRNRENFNYGETDGWLYQALERYGIKDKQVAIMGSEVPIYESICLFFGGKPTTIEYKKIISEDERLILITVDEYSKSSKKFDAAFSISSFEHDGLGRYGDPLNPNGDLLAMKKMKSILKPNGILFLAVHIGIDTLVWNAHRIYGRHRLPLLLKDWELLDDFGFSEDLFNNTDLKQPIFVLKNSI